MSAMAHGYAYIYIYTYIPIPRPQRHIRVDYVEGHTKYTVGRYATQVRLHEMYIHLHVYVLAEKGSRTARAKHSSDPNGDDSSGLGQDDFVSSLAPVPSFFFSLLSPEPDERLLSEFSLASPCAFSAPSVLLVSL